MRTLLPCSPGRSSTPPVHMRHNIRNSPNSVPPFNMFLQSDVYCTDGLIVSYSWLLVFRATLTALDTSWSAENLALFSCTATNSLLTYRIFSCTISLSNSDPAWSRRGAPAKPPRARFIACLSLLQRIDTFADSEKHQITYVITGNAL